MNDYDTISDVINLYEQVECALNKVLIGQSNVKKVVASAILCDKNSKILLTGNTGMGKTTLSNFFKKSFNCERISVTSDLIPSDVQMQLIKNQDLRFLQLEEFNRANGKFQSAFIEFFAEHKITFDGRSFDFGDFYVIATQNSADITGIFNVSQAVYDRFDLNVYFDELTDDEKSILLFDDFCPVSTAISDSCINFTTQTVNNFKISNKDKEVLMQVFNIIDDITINGKKIFAGSNIRAHKYAIKLVKLTALVNGRDYILPSDIVDFIDYLYIHRIDQNVVDMNALVVGESFNFTKKKILSLKR